MIFVLADSEMEAAELIDRLQDGAQSPIRWKWVQYPETIIGQRNYVVLESEGWRYRTRMQQRLLWVQNILTAMEGANVRLWISETNEPRYGR